MLFSGTDGQLTFHLKKTGISYQMARTESWKERPDHKTGKINKCTDKQSVYRVDINWLNSNINSEVKIKDTLPGYCNYYLSHCTNGVLGVKSYKNILFKNLYQGIDLSYYEDNGHLKCDYIVAPYMDYRQIQLEINGAVVEARGNGSILLKTSLGNIEEGKPIVYQNGKLLKAKWIVHQNILSFSIPDYDPGYPLVIDPLTRAWGTYYGGPGQGGEGAGYCAADGQGNVYLASWTEGGMGTIIATTGSHQSTISGPSDAYLAKCNSAGVRLWSTYYGGSGYDSGDACCTDASGYVYLAGFTNSTDNNSIATTGMHQTINNGGDDAFLVKFDGQGVRQWGTYYGGEGADNGYGCTADQTGNIYLIGSTTSSAISTPGAHQNGYGGVSMPGSQDAFVVKFNSSGTRLWCTYYGVLGTDHGYDCCTDPSGNIYLTGMCSAMPGTIIASPGAHQTVHGGFEDAFLVKFDPSGVRLWGTHYGANGYELANGCATDAAGNVYMTGYTTSNAGTVIATPGSHQPILNGSIDAFLVKFDGSGTRLWGTHYGGPGTDDGMKCSTDAFGNVFLAGVTDSNSGNDIATPGSYQPALGGSLDAFITKFSSSGTRLWGTYYGGIGQDNLTDCAIDALGNIFISGVTTDTNGGVIISPGAHQTVHAGNLWDNFLTRFVDCSVLIGSNTPVCEGSTLSLSANVSFTNGTLSWTGPNSFLSSSASPTIPAVQSIHAGVYTLTVVQGAGCNETATSTISILPGPAITVNNGSICAGQVFTIQPSGASSYTIQGGTTIVSPNVSTTYSIIGTSTAGCVSQLVTTSTLIVNSPPTITVNNGTICSGQSYTLLPSGAQTFSFQGGSAIVSPTINSTYTVTGTSSAGCVSQAFTTVTIVVNPLPTITVNSGTICSGESFTILPNGGITHTVQGGSLIVSPATSADYTVAGASSQGCISQNTAVCHILVNALPSVSLSSTGTICSGESATLTASGATQYTWNTNASSAELIISPNSTTSYSVTGTDLNGCSNSVMILQNVDQCVGLKKISTSSETGLSIFPNPNTGVFFIETSCPMPFKIVNALGQSVVEEILITGKNKIDLSTQPSGIYFVTSKEGSLKIIKE